MMDSFPLALAVLLVIYAVIQSLAQLANLSAP